jgi:hypothetical protein
MLHGKIFRVIVLCRFVLENDDLAVRIDRYSDRFHIALAEHRSLEGQASGIDCPRKEGAHAGAAVAFPFPDRVICDMDLTFSVSSGPIV